MVRPIVIALLCCIPLSARADSYRAETLSADAVGLGLLIGGALSEGENGRDTGTSESLFTLGLASTVLATPIIHFAHGERERAVGSFLMRWGSMAAGGLLAIMLNSGCGDGMPPPEGALFDDDFLCELDYVGYGVLGGVVVASAIDAAFMTDKPTRESSWRPQLAASRDGVRVGTMWTW